MIVWYHVISLDELKILNRHFMSIDLPQRGYSLYVLD